MTTCGSGCRANACSARTASIADGDAGLHVEDAGAVEPPVLLAQRHALELADVPDRVEVAEEQRLAGRSLAELRAEVIAALAGRDAADPRAALRQPPAPAPRRSDRPPPCRGSATRAGRAFRSARGSRPCWLSHQACRQVGSASSMHGASTWRLRHNTRMLRAVAADRAFSSRPWASRRSPPQTPAPFPRPGAPDRDDAAGAAGGQTGAAAATPPAAAAAAGQPARPTSSCSGVPIYPGARVPRVVRRRPQPALLPVRHQHAASPRS